MSLRLAVALAVTTAPALAAAPTAPPEPPRPIAIRAARLFDGNGEGHLRNAVVVVEGGVIRAVGAGLPVPAGAEVIDLGDATLLPGFVDAHVHITGESQADWAQATVANLRRTVAETAVRSAEYARRTLMAGFTTIRNLGAGDFVDVGLRNAIHTGYAPGPRILASGNSLGARGGHCDRTGYPFQLFREETGISHGIAAGPDGFRDAVRFASKYGADVIKVCATGGVLSLGDAVDTPQLTQAEMDALVDEAHRLRHQAAAHAHGAEGAKVAIRAGIDSIEHGSFLDDEALRLMKERGTYLVPTAMAVKSTTGGDRRYPPEIAEKAHAAARAHGVALRKAIQAGVRIAFGTDSAVSPHGRNAEEFGLLVDHGMTPAAALRAGTREAAALLGVAGQRGTLEAGKAADIVGVSGDPLADIHATERVTFVMRDGRVYRRP